MVGFNWSCKCCKSLGSKLDIIAEDIKSIKIGQENRLTNLENKVEAIETTNRATIKEEVAEMKDTVKYELQTDLKKLVDERNKEFEDRRRRESNIVFYGMPEPSGTDGLARQNEDEDNVRELARSLGVDYLDIDLAFRLGKPSQGTTRVLKVILEDRKERKFLLDNSKNIRTSTEDKFKNVIIFKDLTIEQRAERKNKLEEKNKEKRLAEAAEIEAQETEANGNNTSISALSQILQDPFNAETMVDMTIRERTANMSVMNVTSNEDTVIGGVRVEGETGQSRD